jgi:hypothetical protein
MGMSSPIRATSLFGQLSSTLPLATLYFPRNLRFLRLFTPLALWTGSLAPLTFARSRLSLRSPSRARSSPLLKALSRLPSSRSHLASYCKFTSTLTQPKRPLTHPLLAPVHRVIQAPSRVLSQRTRRLFRSHQTSSCGAGWRRLAPFSRYSNSSRISRKLNPPLPP